MYKDSYLVEKIVAKKGNRVKLRYFGMGEKHDTWEPLENVDKDLIDDFTNRKKKK